MDIDEVIEYLEDYNVSNRVEAEKFVEIMGLVTSQQLEIEELKQLLLESKYSEHETVEHMTEDANELKQEIERLKGEQWISVDDRLPEEGKYVIAKHNRGTWSDSEDQENVNTVVVKLRKGLSMEDREKMDDCNRKLTYRCDDEHGNNLVPYSWHQFGSDHFFGQSITQWMYIPKAPEGENNAKEI